MDDTCIQDFHIPEDILLEILFKLPPNILFRFKCVSKKWFCLISDPSFFPYYILRSKHSPPFTFLFQCDNMREIHLFGPDHGHTLKKLINSRLPSDEAESVKVEATCNDLILYQSNHGDEYFVASLFSRQYVKFPVHGRAKSGVTGFISVVRNGITSYNIARLVKDMDMCLSIYSFCSITGEWRNFKPKNCMLGIEFDNRPCIVYKQALHWICSKMNTLLAYDPCSSPDECRFINLPNSVYYKNGMNAILGVSKEKLCYFEMNSISIHDNKLPGWKLWVLKDYSTGEWILDCQGTQEKIEAFGVLFNVLSAHSPLIPVAFHPWDKGKIYFWHESYVLSFNCKTERFEDELFRLNSDGMISTWEIFPLSIPSSPSKLDEP